jgi:predicted glycosyl hydrolase (DUF1957 family)
MSLLQDSIIQDHNSKALEELVRRELETKSRDTYNKELKNTIAQCTESIYDASKLVSDISCVLKLRKDKKKII